MTVEVRQAPDDSGGMSDGVPGGPARLDRLEGLGRLECLAEVLAGHGLRARLMTPPGRVPRLHVVNPAAAALAEDIYAGPGQDGQWWFWWSWAERIASSQDLTTAAAQIGRVLAARDGPPAP